MYLCRLYLGGGTRFSLLTVHFMGFWTRECVTEIDGLSLWLVTRATCQKVSTGAAMR